MLLVMHCDSARACLAYFSFVSPAGAYVVAISVSGRD